MLYYSSNSEFELEFLGRHVFKKSDQTVCFRRHCSCINVSCIHHTCYMYTMHATRAQLQLIHDWAKGSMGLSPPPTSELLKKFLYFESKYHECSVSILKKVLTPQNYFQLRLWLRCLYVKVRSPVGCGALFLYFYFHYFLYCGRDSSVFRTRLDGWSSRLFKKYHKLSLLTRKKISRDMCVLP